MEQRREQTIMLLRDECRRIFTDLKHQAESMDTSRFGVFPKQAVIIYKESSSAAAQLRAWRLCGSSIDECATPVQPIDITACSGMYYSEGRFVFLISDSLTAAQIDMTLGPRYGRGYEYTLDHRFERPKLGDRREIWRS